jgi:hypothetical protein
MEGVITNTFNVKYSDKIQNFAIISHPVLVLFNIVNHYTEFSVIPQRQFLRVL